MAVDDGQGRSLLLPFHGSSSSSQHRKEERGEEGHFEGSSQKLHVPLSHITHWLELGHGLHLATKKTGNIAFILGSCEPI